TLVYDRSLALSQSVSTHLAVLPLVCVKRPYVWRFGSAHGVETRIVGVIPEDPTSYSSQFLEPTLSYLSFPQLA
ncbi:hypothetical protein J6590_102773, partial [Homalodisca vitripennis]